MFLLPYPDVCSRLLSWHLLRKHLSFLEDNNPTRDLGRGERELIKKGTVLDRHGSPEGSDRSHCLFVILLHWHVGAQCMQPVLMDKTEYSGVSKHRPILDTPLTPNRSTTQHQDVVAALRAAGGRYGRFAALLDSLQQAIIHEDITIFAPNDRALAEFHNLNTSKAVTEMLNFHTLSAQLPFSSLLRLKVGTRLPTPVTNVTILVISIAASAYGVDNAVIVDPDLYTDATVAIHGVNAVFNTSEYNIQVPTPDTVPQLSPRIVTSTSPPSAGCEINCKSVQSFLLAMAFMILQIHTNLQSS